MLSREYEMKLKFGKAIYEHDPCDYTIKCKVCGHTYGQHYDLECPRGDI